MLALLIVVAILALVSVTLAVAALWNLRREPPAVAVLESQEPREAVQRSINRRG